MRSVLCFAVLFLVRIVSSEEHVTSCVDVERNFVPETNNFKQPVCICADKGIFSTISGFAIECESSSITTITANLKSLNGTEIGALTIRDSTINVLPNDMFVNVHPKQLKLERCGISSLTSSGFGSIGDSVEYLSLRDNRVKILQSNLFESFSKIKTIDLTGNKISEIQDGAFGKLKNLQELMMNGNELTELTPGMFRGLKALKKLNLENCAIQKIHKATFQGLDSLEQLILAENQLETLDWTMFSSLKNLRILDIGSNKLQNVEMKSMKKLEKLILNNNHIDSMKNVRLRDLPSLVVVMIDRNKMSSIGDKDLMGLVRSERIETLSLSWNNISEVGQKTFQSIPHLISLLLQNNQLTQLSTNSTPFLEPLKNLQTLQVSANNLTVIRAGELPKSLLNLALDHNTITRIEPRALEGMALKRIYLHSNKLQFLYQGAFDSIVPSSLEAIDVSLNNWQCVCKDPKEWLPRWLSAAEESDVSEGPIGCLAIPGCGNGGVIEEFEEEEEVIRSGWITVAATILTVVTICMMVFIALLYFKDHRHQFSLRGRRSDSDLHKLIENDPLNLPTDSILIVPAMPKRNNGPKKTVRFQQTY